MVTEPQIRFELMCRAMIGDYMTEPWRDIDWAFAHALEPEPDYDVPEPPEDWDDEDVPHYDTPMGF